VSAHACRCVQFIWGEMAIAYTPPFLLSFIDPVLCFACMYLNHSFFWILHLLNLIYKSGRKFLYNARYILCCLTALLEFFSFNTYILVILYVVINLYCQCSTCRVPLLDLHKLNEPDSQMDPIVSFMLILAFVRHFINRSFYQLLLILLTVMSGTVCVLSTAAHMFCMYIAPL